MFTTYRLAFRFLKNGFALFAVSVGVIWAGGLAIEGLGTSQSVLFVAYVLIAYAFHRALLFHEISSIKAPQDPVRPIAMGRFFWVSTLMTTAMIAVGVLAAVVMATTGNANVMRESALGIGIIAMVFANVVLLTVFGTALPAAASADRYGFGITLRRARCTWAKILFGMIAGPGTFWLIYLFALLWLTRNVMPVAPAFGPDTGFDIGQALLSLALTCCTTFATLLTVIVLCRAYKDVASDDVRAVISGAVSEP